MTVSTESFVGSSNSRSNMVMLRSHHQDQQQGSRSESHGLLIVLQHSRPREQGERSIDPRPHRRL
jgi:hypothetical protein